MLGGDTVAVAVQSSDYLFVGPYSGRAYDSVRVPVVRRRGAQSELLREIDPRIPSTIERALYKPS